MRMRRRTAAFVLLALAQAPARAADAPERVIRYSDDRLSVKLTLAPVAEVIDEIGHQTGAEIRGQLAEVREVSAEFDEVPLPEALHRLLGTQNFALVYGDKGKLKALELLGAARTSGGPVASAPAPTTPPARPPEEIVLSWLARPVPIPPGSPLARVLASPTASVRQILEVGVRHDDPSVRNDAVRIALQSAESQPDVRPAVAAAVGDLDDGSLINMLRGSAGEYAEEVARLVATQTKIAPLRLKANSVLQSINQEH